MSIIKEFKEFAMRGNVLDMAVGVVIGGAFGKIVSSLVADVIMPFVSIFTGSVNFTNWKVVLKQAVMEGTAVVTPEVAVNYGMLIQVIFDFLIIAVAIFLIIKAINRLKKKEDEKPASPATPPEDVLLLREIRDLLKSNVVNS
ncbi:MAG: large-conductance mechanosensitive channel protein MscL [Tannerella sp.]|jgi:large conductance mechanosensitive channel|nr:large-conductance mechanosensitive channel protein MscL [Tannerella sp.]